MMKDLKYTTIVFVVGLALLAQLTSATLVHADGEVTPQPVYSPEITIPPQLTEAPTQDPLSKSPVSEAASSTPVAVDSSTHEPSSNPANRHPAATPTVDLVETRGPDSTQQGLAKMVPFGETPTPDIFAPTATLSTTPTVASMEKSIRTSEPPTTAAESVSETVTPAETSSPSDLAAAKEMTLLEAVQSVSSDTSVVILDQNGQPLPLAAQDAAEAIANGDPIWCPAGQVPTPGANGCTDSTFSGLIPVITMAQLLAYYGPYINSQSGDGTIWITSGSIPDSALVTIDGATYTNWATHSLTLQGGWSGNYGDTIIGANSVFSVPIQILNWNAVVTLNNITVQNAAGSGLGVTTNGKNVVINNSRFINNKAGSGSFPWGDGADISPNGGNVTVTNSEFSGNNWDGLYIVNSGNISITNSNLNSNGLNGYGGGLNAYQVNTIDIRNGQFDGNMRYDISAFCNRGIPLNVSYPDGIRLDILVDQFCQANAVLAVTPTAVPTATPTGPPLTPTPTLIGPPPTPTTTPIIQPPPTIAPQPTPIGTIQPTPTRELPPIRPPASYSSSASRPKSKGEIFLDCKLQPSFTYPLPNGDKVEIICPSDSWSGKAAISRLDNTSLPGELPSGFTYASAFQVDISQLKEPFQVIGGQLQRQSVDVIPKPGYMKASFVAPSIQSFGGTFSILYWDNGAWIPLKDFMLAENGGPQVFELHPGSQEDPKKIILSGVEDNIDNPEEPRVEVSTNFPGIFVLAQY